MRLMIDDPPQTIVARDESRYEIGIKIPKVSYASFTEVMVREIDTRPCEEFSPSDLHWGESDSLANIPRKTVPTWIRALSHVDRGDE